MFSGSSELTQLSRVREALNSLALYVMRQPRKSNVSRHRGWLDAGLSCEQNIALSHDQLQNALSPTPARIMEPMVGVEASIKRDAFLDSGTLTHFSAEARLLLECFVGNSNLTLARTSNTRPRNPKRVVIDGLGD